MGMETQPDADARPICRHCGKPFDPHPNLARPEQQRYCGQTCRMYAYHARRAKRELAERLLAEAATEEDE